MKSTYAKRNGHERYKIVKKNRNHAATSRRKIAIEALESDLEQGTLRVDGVRTEDPLTETQITRIKKEIVNLKSKM